MKIYKSNDAGQQKQARGYRLRLSTQVMIAKLQRMLKCDQDKVIAASCSLLYAELQRSPGSEYRQTIINRNTK